MAGKGDDRRPSQVSEAELARNWERTFGPPPRGMTFDELEHFAREVEAGRIHVVRPA